MIMMADRKKTVAAILGPHPDSEKEKEPISTPCQIAAEELIEAIQSKDAEGVVESLKAIFAEFDSEPHVEGEHI